MGRWEPDAAGRLRAAALELFEEIGYDQTTVAAIAERAGVTSRTFFRHFADKREVLFQGSERLQAQMQEALARVPEEASAFDAVAAALAAPSAFFTEELRPFSRRRAAVIVAHPELHERELIKLVRLAEALAEALRTRGVPAPDASLAAEAGIAVFRVAFARWVAPDERRGWDEVVREALARMRALVNAH